MNTNDLIWDVRQAHYEAQALRDFESQYLRIMGAIGHKMSLDVYQPGSVIAGVDQWVLDTLNWLQGKIVLHRQRRAEFEKHDRERRRLTGEFL